MAAKGVVERSKSPEDLCALGFPVTGADHVKFLRENPNIQLIVSCTEDREKELEDALDELLSDINANPEKLLGEPRNQYMCPAAGQIKLTNDDRKILKAHSEKWGVTILAKVVTFKNTKHDVGIEITFCSSQTALDSFIFALEMLNKEYIEAKFPPKEFEVFPDVNFSRLEAMAFIGPRGNHVKHFTTSVGRGNGFYAPNPTLIPDIDSLSGMKSLAFKKKAIKSNLPVEIDTYVREVEHWLSRRRNAQAN
jgi:hypothetical protein